MLPSTRLSPEAPPPKEMSDDPGFGRRIKRLVAISAVALGMISLLAILDGHVGRLSVVMLFSGWLLMPAILYTSLQTPPWRYLLMAPAGLVSAALVILTIGYEGSPQAGLGWWLVTGGVLLGAGLGAWFWFRMLPVPDRLTDPFSAGRWVLIAVHTGLVVAGMTVILLSL